MVSYEPLWRTMQSRGLTTYTLIHKYRINPRTIYSLKHNMGVTVYTLERLCNILECTPNDILKFE
ncbi:XRE family transcriptional regulator [Anaerotruncus colihominis]|uniref:Helix-turn-helix transcriptional regulator n=2 Tax=Oscillospiraceae TaxID=216572 RepID=A0A845SVP5_9FIRM|nr:helix-turn-helix transcriptional regulator [Anaerotruncus sp.]NBI78631.1 XRE family transcriptional regulator [Anaerotruncus colihominis]NDO38382.1 helix-turn-helix transcriptional regulator [Anaerotruncus colihominis]